MKVVFEKWKSLLVFAVFGALATVLDGGVYWIFYEKWGVPNVTSAFLGWFFAVFFCFFTNKYFVYGEKDADPKTVLRELLSFFLLRSSTGVLNIVAMYVLVDRLHLWPVGMKVLVSIILGFVNYLLGKTAVFRKS